MDYVWILKGYDQDQEAYFDSEAAMKAYVDYILEKTPGRSLDDNRLVMLSSATGTYFAYYEGSFVASLNRVKAVHWH